MNRHLAPALGAMAAGMLLLQPVTTLADPPAHAHNENSAQYRSYPQSHDRYGDDRGARGSYESRYDGDRDRRWDDRDDDRRYDYDHRQWGSHHYHPRRGHVVHHLPPRHRVVHHHGHRYYYGNGAWYQPFGPRYVVVEPPVGLVVSFLPQFSTTTYFGGVPHYRSGPVYYVWNPRARGYVVTDRPYRRW